MAIGRTDWRRHDESNPAPPRSDAHLGRRAGLARRSHQRQPHRSGQALHHCSSCFLWDRGRARHAYPGSTCDARKRFRRTGGLRTDLHDAWQYHDVPVRHSHAGRAGHLSAAQDSWRARSRLSAADCSWLVVLPVRRFDHDPGAAGRRGARCGLVPLSAAVGQGVYARRQFGRLAIGHYLRRDFGDVRRDRNRGDYPEVPRCEHVVDQNADHGVVSVGDGRNDDLRLSAADPRVDPAGTRTRVRLAVLPARTRRIAAPVAAPVLAVRPSGSLYHLPAGGRCAVHHHSGHGTHTAHRVRRDRDRGHGARLSQLWLVGPPHVHHRHSAHGAGLFLCRIGAGGDTDCRPDIRLDRYDLGRATEIHAADVLHSRFFYRLRAGRPDGRDACDRALRPAGTRYRLCNRTPALRACRWVRIPDAGSGLLLDAARHRADARDAIGHRRLLADLHRFQPDVPAYASDGSAGYAASHVHLSCGSGLDLAQPNILRRQFHAGLWFRPLRDRHRVAATGRQSFAA